MPGRHRGPLHFGHQVPVSATAVLPGYETSWERELMEADEMFRDWNDLGCPADHPGAELYE